MCLGGIAQRVLSCSGGRDPACADHVEQGGGASFKLLTLGGVVRNRWPGDEQRSLGAELTQVERRNGTGRRAALQASIQSKSSHRFFRIKAAR